MVMRDELEFSLEHFGPVPWSNFLLNPRKLRGSDFLMRWSQGVWSEQQLVRAVDAAGEFFALPYGPSGVAPTEDVRAYELYFERLEHAGLAAINVQICSYSGTATGALSKNSSKVSVA